MIKSVNDNPIHAVFNPETSVVFQIPKYQREYAWSKDQWEDLFNDLMDEASVDGHFLGSIIAINHTQDALTESVLELVDGQQRITTLTLFLLAVYVELQEIKDSLDDDEMADLSNLRRMLTLKNPIRPRVRLQRQNNNNDDFLVIFKEAGLGVTAPNVSNVGNRRIKRSYKYFQKAMNERFENSELDRKDFLLDVFARIKRAILITLEVESHADAFVLFESLNNRGLSLSPIDLIKNALLAKADRDQGIDVDEAYQSWELWLENLGPEYVDQERFFRQFYNAFKIHWSLSVPNVPVATRTKLINVYEVMIKGDYESFIERVDVASDAYARIIGRSESSKGSSPLDQALQDLGRAQGASTYILLMFLLVNREQLMLGDKELVRICRFLTKFSIRRNLTNSPPTYELDRIFMNLVEKVEGREGDDVYDTIASDLILRSSSDEVLLEALSGPIYEENSMVTRYILTTLTTVAMTKEVWVDLWETDAVGESKTQYRWTIEHIVPQGKKIPDCWKEMLGGHDEAQRVLDQEVHFLGNLTITAYNATLSNKCFEEKRDRTNADGNFVGYRNGLEINKELAEADSWTSERILARTGRLAIEALGVLTLRD
jgi:hypothetical protein